MIQLLKSSVWLYASVNSVLVLLEALMEKTEYAWYRNVSSHCDMCNILLYYISDSQELSKSAVARHSLKQRLIVRLWDEHVSCNFFISYILTITGDYVQKFCGIKFNHFSLTSKKTTHKPHVNDYLVLLEVLAVSQVMTYYWCWNTASSWIVLLQCELASCYAIWHCSVISWGACVHCRFCWLSVCEDDSTKQDPQLCPKLVTLVHAMNMLKCLDAGTFRAGISKNCRRKT